MGGIDTPLTLTLKREKSKGDSKGNGGGKAWTWGGKSNGGGKSFGSENGEPDTNIFVTDLPADVDDAKLQEVFAQYGTVTWCKVMKAGKGKSGVAAIVEFGDFEEAKWGGEPERQFGAGHRDTHQRGLQAEEEQGRRQGKWWIRQGVEPCVVSGWQGLHSVRQGLVMGGGANA